VSGAGASEPETVNLDTVRRLFLELFGNGHVELADQLMTDDYVNHDPSPGAGSTRADVQAVAAWLSSRPAPPQLAPSPKGIFAPPFACGSQPS